jgi:uncharacterized membrane protein
MPIPSSLVPAGFSLGAFLLWGTSDFVGGYAVRRADAFLFTAITHASGGLLMLALARLDHSPFPNRNSAEWALAAGVFAGLSLAIFYRALAAGKMGLTAPVSAVLGAAIAAGVGMATEGPPGAAATLWIAGLSRTCSFVVTVAVLVLRRHFGQIDLQEIGLGMLAGVVDVSGSVLFVRATQTGRLDSAVVISSLYPAVTVLLARLILRERFTRWKVIGMLAALLAVPMIALP